MEKRKWLWKRKPSERSPGETESSGSFSSHSERYSDDQDGIKTLANDNTQSPEVTSKVTIINDEIDDNVKILTEKLSAALVNVSAKEDLVKQHSKVAEEAVAGWEKAENEVALLKQQLNSVIQKNSALEDRGNHLDGALKECVRQLRQGKEEQDQKIHEVILEKSREWEFIKNDLESHLDFLEKENSLLKESQTESQASVPYDILRKLDFLERENKAMKHELLSLSEELEIITTERDLSAQAAENASKLHLDGIKKVAKLEAECRRLTILNRKSLLSHDQKSVSASSVYMESLTDSHSDSGERSNFITEIDHVKTEKSLRASVTGSSLEIDIMDDFLEMERLVALPKSVTKDKNQNLDLNSTDNQLKAEFETMSYRVVDLEEKLKSVEAEKNELEKVLSSNRNSFEENQLKAEFEAMNSRIIDLEEKIKNVEAENNELEKVLASNRNSYEQNQVKAADLEAMSYMVVDLGEKIKSLISEKNVLEKVLVSSQNSYEENQVKAADLEAMSYHVSELEDKIKTIEAEKNELEKVLNISRNSSEENQIKADLEAMTYRAFELEDTLKKIESEKIELEEAVASTRSAYEESQIHLQQAEMKLEVLQKELNNVNESKEIIEFQLTGTEAEAQNMSSKVGLLEDEIVKEKSFSEEIAIKCRVLEDELAKKSQEIDVQQAAMANGTIKIEQEEMDVAAGKLAECQKTIASLGRQLQSLATLEDFLIDTTNLPGFSENSNFWKLQSNGTISENNCNQTYLQIDNSAHLANGDNDEKPPFSPSLSTSSKGRNGFGKLFTRTMSGIQLENKQKL